MGRSAYCTLFTRINMSHEGSTREKWGFLSKNTSRLSTWLVLEQEQQQRKQQQDLPPSGPHPLSVGASRCKKAPWRRERERERNETASRGIGAWGHCWKTRQYILGEAIASLLSPRGHPWPDLSLSFFCGSHFHKAQREREFSMWNLEPAICLRCALLLLLRLHGP